MVLEGKEDQSAPIGEAEVLEASKTNDETRKRDIINKILGSFNEKRDAYYGVISSVIYIIKSEDVSFKNMFIEGISQYITSNPMRYGGKVFITKGVNRLHQEQPKFVIELFERIIKSTPIWSYNFDERSEVLRISIIAIKAIRQAEQTTVGLQSNLPSEKFEELYNEAIEVCDDRTKVDTLSLVLSSRCTTKVFEEKELNIYRRLFQDALSLQEPALRQIFLSKTNKLIIRLVESLRVVVRDIKLRTQDEISQIRLRYNDFITWLINFCLGSIYCNAYFGSFILTISTLKLIIQHVGYSNEFIPIESLLRQRSCYDSILSCLNDSFEENKTIALELLLSLPYNEEFINETNIKSFEELAFELVSSVNPAHSLTCQFLFRLVIGLRLKSPTNNMSKNQLLYTYLNKLVEIVEQNVIDTRENFLLALKQKCIYPKLTCIRALISDIKLDNLDCDRELWKSLAKRIVSVSIEACEAVSGIVCNLNPETMGHLPMDLKPINADTLAKTLKVSMKISNDEITNISSQMLLISGWKTIKECSLSLGNMCIRFWWPKERIKIKREKFPGLDIDPILEEEDIIKIIEFFDHYLRNLRHRGAFEQAYNGFILVTRRVWFDDKFRSLLVDTLKKIMHDFKTDATDDKKVQCLKAYVTRRSAGLPFIVQAILNSEHKHDSQTLRWIMASLFEVLDKPDAEQYQRIHCLNILRALTKEHFLGEKILTYAGRTFDVAMEAFKSDSFPIRNCASMLLKAAVDRAFGINRLKDEIHRRNQLSFERFFMECPSLQRKIIDSLEAAPTDRRYLASVHAAFIILFRLRPSREPSEEYSNEKMILPFIEPVTKLAFSCPDYKLRGLAAKLAVRLEGFCINRCIGCPNGSQLQYCESRVSWLRKLILSSRGDLDRNRLHGALLFVRNWLEQTSDLSLECQEKFSELAQETVKFILLNDTCASIKLTALDIIESFNVKQPDSLEWLTDLYSWLVSLYTTNDNSPTKPEAHYESFLFMAAITLLMGVYREHNSDKDKRLAEENDKIQASEQRDELRISGLRQFLNILPELLARQSNGVLSLSLQASLIRFIRQLLNETNKTSFVDDLLDKLDMDLTAAHVTPYDKLNSKAENDSERDKWVRYCERKILSQQVKSSILNNREMIFNFTSYNEFKLYQVIDAANQTSGNQKFSAKFSNNPRAVELLTLAYKNWELFELDTHGTWKNCNETTSDKLDFLVQFITDLPDCDVKCLALLCASKLMKAVTSQLHSPTFNPGVLQKFSRLLDMLTDGDHSLTVRLTCAEVIRSNLSSTMEMRHHKNLNAHLTNLFSALIKLSQDEDLEVRLFSQKVMLTIRQFNDGLTIKKLDGQHETKLSQLIGIISIYLFDPNVDTDLNDCFRLLMRIVFNNSTSFSNDLSEDQERLFDKTKLNTFVDHIATIDACLEGLDSFFKRHESLKPLGGKVNLDRLRFPEEIVKELNVVDSSGVYDTGDYSWRLKRIQQCNQSYNDFKVNHNNQVVDKFLLNITQSLDYFANGYINVLSDTEYTHHELSLYKRISFIKFVMNNTIHELGNAHLVENIRQELGRIVTKSNSTTILCKCLNLINSVTD